MISRISLFVLIFTCLTPLGFAESVVIRNVSVLDVEGERFVSAQRVDIEDGRIQSVAADTDAEITSTEIDGTGKFLMPSLWDMHAHYARKRAVDIRMPLLLAHGVTGVRLMSSSIFESNPVLATLDDFRTWQAAVDAGELLAPRIVAVASPPLNGSRMAVPDRITFFQTSTEEDARTTARYSKERYDIIKIYNDIPREPLLALLDEARKLGIRTGGHKPRAISAIDASNAGFGDFEHARVLVYESWPGAQDLIDQAPRSPSRKQLQQMTAQHDRDMAREIISTFVRNGTVMCPTHVTRQMDAFAGDPDYRNDSRTRYIPDDELARWEFDADRYVDQDGSTVKRDAFTAIFELGLELTGLADRMGVTILLGTDVGDTYVFPGSSTHDELELLVRAGLSPARAVRAGTLNPARYLGLDSDYGTVAAGKCADLLLLNENPLEDIAHTRSINTLFFNGNVLTAPALEAMKEEAAKRANGDK